MFASVLSVEVIKVLKKDFESITELSKWTNRFAKIGKVLPGKNWKIDYSPKRKEENVKADVARKPVKPED
jgi:hypothetical protein